MSDVEKDMLGEILDAPAVLGLGELITIRWKAASRATAVLRDPVSRWLIALFIRPGELDDRAVIELLEHWAAVRRHYHRRRVGAVLVAGSVPDRLRNALAVVGQAVPILALEAHETDGHLECSPIDLAGATDGQAAFLHRRPTAPPECSEPPRY